MSKLLDSLDIILFIVVLAGVGFLLGTGFGLGLEEKDKAVAAAETAQVTIDEAIEKGSYEGDEGYSILKHLLDLPDEIEQQWSPEVVARPYVKGVFYHGPSLSDMRAEKDLELRFFAPTELQGTSDIGKIRVFWEIPDGNTVSVEKFEIYRSSGDDEVLVGAVDGKENSFVDGNVVAGQLYKYRVRGISNDPLMVQSNRQASPFSKPFDVRGARDYAFEFLSYDSETKIARVKVKRYVDGIWHEKVFDVVKGKKMGLKDVGTGIDYETPCEVFDIEVGFEMVPEERDEVEFDGTGRVIVASNGKPITKHVTYERRKNFAKLYYRDELGEKAELRLDL